MTTVLATMAIAFLTSLVGTLTARRVALRIGLTDRPDGHRKTQREPVALGGGAAVLVGLLTSLAAVWVLPNPLRERLLENAHDIGILLAAGGAIVLLGLADDRFSLRGRQKLVGQVLVTLMLALAGFTIRKLRIFDVNIEMGLLSIPFTVFWLLGAINALNFIDGIDGLASTVGIILSMAIGILAMLTGHFTEGIVAWAFAASLLGFLCFNFPPARIYLGDAGSMLIGLIVGALAIRASLKGPATVALAAPLAIWTIPIFDVTAAIVRRRLTGRSVYTTDRGHLHHRLLDATGNNALVVAMIGVACAVTCAGATLSVHYNNDLLAFFSVVPVVGILVATRVFGHVEVLLLTTHVRALGRSMLRPAPRGGDDPVEASFRLQGSRPWDEIWEALTEFADKLDLSAIQLDVNLPALAEDFHASWRRPSQRQLEEQWKTEIPLWMGSQRIGRLVVSGERRAGSSCAHIERLMDLLEPLETRLIHMAAGTLAVEKPTRAGILVAPGADR
ncbi:MAG TPA: MraY family glycosyltransferase [Pirellulales bacterium]|jgi:UDP-GlcNAc:undecaprenyl-phosphate GlcNAc-1-phosphate transferase|nr:MraY family glycosyltransferase [Pirellulales bacterium]